MIKKRRILSLFTAAACSIATMVGATLYTAAEEATEPEKTVTAATYETEYEDVKTASNEIGLSTTRAVTTVPAETTTTLTTTTTITTIPIVTMMPASETQISLSGAYIHNETVTLGGGIPCQNEGEFSSSDESVVAINEYGNPVAVGVGTASVSVKQGNYIVEVIYVTVEAPVIESEVIQGDITNDGTTDLYDAVEIAKGIMEKRAFNEEEVLTADYNGDGVVNLYDVIEIAKLLME